MFFNTIKRCWVLEKENCLFHHTLLFNQEVRTKKLMSGGTVCGLRGRRQAVDKRPAAAM